MIEFTWDARKARRNEREHGISFPIARVALQSGLAIAVEEQFREGEWRTNVVVPFRGISLLTVTIADETGETDGDSYYTIDEETEQAWAGGVKIVRIITAREATAREQRLYFTYRPPSLG